MVVDRHRVHPERRGEPAHRHRLEAFVVHDPQSGLEDRLPAQPLLPGPRPAAPPGTSLASTIHTSYGTKSYNVWLSGCTAIEEGSGMSEKPLAGKVALVTGATRAAGRGTAVQLGAAGATVYVTGRTTRTRQSEMRRPETIEETAELVDAAGGHGIAVRVDHTDAEQVRALVDRIEAEQGA